jgi:hypothetical protein
MHLHRAAVYVKLPFADIAFVLPVRILDLASDFFAPDAENRYAVREEDAVIENLKFLTLNLLDVAIEVEFAPIVEDHHPFFVSGLSNALQNGCLANTLACSPKTDPCVMRVPRALRGKETLDEKEEAPARADHQEAA